MLELSESSLEVLELATSPLALLALPRHDLVLMKHDYLGRSRYPGETESPFLTVIHYISVYCFYCIVSRNYINFN